MVKKTFKSKFLVFYLIFSFLLLTTTEVNPNKVDLDSNKEFKPVVRVKEAGEEIPAAQKNRFERLIEKGKKLFQEEMDYEGAIKTFKEAQALAITRAQKADVYFYLSLVYYATLEEKGTEEFDETIRKLTELDYYRELDKRLCPPKYIELCQEIKKEYGALKIQSKPPGANVYLNESKVPVGKTPLTIGAKAGAVKIRVKKGNKEKKEILRVIAGKETASSIFVLKGGSSLLLIIGGIVLAGGAGAALLAGKKGNGGGNGTPALVYGSIQVNSTPTGAQVFLDGSNTGKTTNCTLTDVSPGSHTLKIVKEGYEDEQISVSVTAGQTATLDLNLTEIIITIPEITSDTVWTTGKEVKIKWDTSGSGSSQGIASTGAGLNPLINQGRSALSRFQRRAFQQRRFQRRAMKEGRKLENVDSSGNRGKLSSNTSKPQVVSGETSSSAKKGDIVHKRANDTGNINRNSFGGRVNIPVVPQISNDKFMPSGNLRVLGLSYVKIDLYKGDTLNKTITESTENDGSYLWTVDPSLEGGTDYKVRISSPDDSTVYGDSPNFEIRYPEPNAPSNLEATAVSSSQIDLSWTDNSNDESGFKIERKEGASGTWSQIATVNADVTIYEDTGLEIDTTYYYRVRAYNAAGNSDYSNEPSATPELAAPTKLQATAVSSSQIDLSWDDNSSNEDGFIVERKKGTSGIWNEIGTVSSNITAYQDKGLDPNITYCYQIKAFKGLLYSGYSNEPCAK